jgi:hypothetical protein
MQNQNFGLMNYAHGEADVKGIETNTRKSFVLSRNSDYQGLLGL